VSTLTPALHSVAARRAKTRGRRLPELWSLTGRLQRHPRGAHATRAAQLSAMNSAYARRQPWTASIRAVGFSLEYLNQ
jgi:hypothetical protein